MTFRALERRKFSRRGFYFLIKMRPEEPHPCSAVSVLMKLKSVLGLSLAAWFLVLLWGEAKRPLRPSLEPKGRRMARNIAIAGLAGILLQLTELPLTLWLTKRVETRRLGLLSGKSLPAWLCIPLSVALLDYTLYIWHVINHKIPALWRFHVVHHVDLDMDASTALRFHFAEMGISVAWRLVQIRFLGIGRASLLAWQAFLMFCIMFHHSNIRLPFAFEKRLNAILVTPRMHGIHHSVIEEETNSNWSSGLTVWDKIHGTYRAFSEKQSGKIVIGVPAYREKTEVGLISMIELPFKRQKPTWKFACKIQKDNNEA